MIRVLDDSTINKIAAGEVVARPASVVKELIENSIDAGSSRIFIEIREGGKSFIRVTDDGSGMNSADAEMCIERHATSKIADAQDLTKIMTLGFRGEALASIAAVSKTTIKTSNGKGTQISIEGGAITAQKSIVIPRGTTVVVNDLFYNVPARKKHLKKIETELRNITDIVTQYALININIHFELVHDKNIIIKSPITKDLLNNIATIYGSDFAKNMISIDNEQISGLISVPGFQKPTKNYQAIYVNGRYVKSSTVADAVYESYHTYLNIGKHPAYILNILVDPELVDVNVHPQKSRIRFVNDDFVKQVVKDAITQILHSAKPVVSEVHQEDMKLESFNFVNIEQKPISKTKPKQNFRILGQILSTYVIVATTDGMLIVDQHAAHERVNYEKYMDQYKEQDVSAQTLLEPIVMEVSPSEYVLMKQHTVLINRLGFNLESFGKGSFILRSIPLIFDRLQGRDILLSILDELKSGKSIKLDSVKEERIIRRACRESIKANDRLEIPELIDLMNDLFAAKQPKTCPHGRPTMLNFTADEFEKMFRRKL